VNKGLTSFRALAFLAVLFSHLNIKNGVLGLGGGYLGVSAFFVLSGFLLTPILVNMRASLKTKDYFVHFYGRRALRIFPLYYAYLMIVAIASLVAITHYSQPGQIQPHRFIEQLPWTLTYTYDFFHASNYFEHTFLATHFWSLAVEEQFYLVWPLAIFFIPVQHLKRFLLVVIMTGPLMRLLLEVIMEFEMLPTFYRNDLVIYVLPFSHFDAFAIGGYFAMHGKSRSGSFVWFSIMLVIMLGIITEWLTTGHINLSNLGFGPFMQDSYKYIWGYSLVNLVLALMLVNIKNKTFMPAFFENRALVYLGTISYGLYVFHFPIFWLVYSSMRGAPEIVRAITVLVITIIISSISYELMEKRFIGLKDRYFSRD
jgi:peptidoglycan/LPS O-acetylase OafA/YrhL